MKTLATNIASHLANGLPPDNQVRRGFPCLLDMKNLKPLPTGGAVAPERPKWPIANATEPAQDWPCPQFVRGEDKTVRMDKTALYTVSESSWNQTAATVVNSRTGSALSITTGGWWHSASFQKCLILSNGATLAFDIPSGAGFGTGQFQGIGADICGVSALCAFGDRLVVAGLSGSWFSTNEWAEIMNAYIETDKGEQFMYTGMGSLDRLVIVFERAGGATDYPFYAALGMLGCFGTTKFAGLKELLMEYIEQRKIKMFFSRSPGAIRRITRVGDRIAVFTGSDVTEYSFQPDGIGMLEERILDAGISYAAAVGGPTNKYLMISSSGYAHLRVMGAGIAKLDRNHLFAGGGSWVISYDPEEEDFWVSNGTKTHIVTSDGKFGSSDFMPTSLFRTPDKGLVGCAKVPATYTPLQVSFKTNLMDMDERDSKKCTTVCIQGDGLRAMKVEMLWRIGIDGDLRAGNRVPCTPDGVGHPNQAFIDGQLYFEGMESLTEARRAAVYNGEIQYHAEGLRFRRGTKAGAGPVQSEG